MNSMIGTGNNTLWKCIETILPILDWVATQIMSHFLPPRNFQNKHLFVLDFSFCVPFPSSCPRLWYQVDANLRQTRSSRLHRWELTQYKTLKPNDLHTRLIYTAFVNHKHNQETGSWYDCDELVRFGFTHHTCLIPLHNSRILPWIEWFLEIPVIVPQSGKSKRDAPHLLMKFCTHKHF